MIKEKSQSQLIGSSVNSEEMNHVIANLNEEKRILESKYWEQNQNIIELHKNFYRV